MQAIQAKYIGPTNSRWSRIKAWCAVGSLTVPYPYELNGIACHQQAAEMLAEKLGWTSDDYGHLVGGALAIGYAFVFGKDGA